ncbi:MuDR family transposase [Melia azedarach]|uniref:MuDR family transposase n=1 Tax=Melia azedarach TaxID=155640 RepID=A0ACC1WV05_MELAZ|nr:MuDR family transposase [Melia azedarach]
MMNNNSTTPRTNDLGDFEEDEAHWSDEDDEKGELEMHEEGGEKNEENDSDIGEKSDILSNYASADGEGEIMSSFEDKDHTSKMITSLHRDRFQECANGNFVFQVGQQFENAKQFRVVLQKFIIKEGFELNRIKNDKIRFRATCAAQGCPWFIYASMIKSGTVFQIQKLNNEHNCDRVTHTREASYIWIANQFQSALKNNPQMPIRAIRADLRTKFGVHCNKKKIYRAKKKALETASIDHRHSYKKLIEYAEILRQTNPGVLVKIKYSDVYETTPPKFQRFMFSFQALKKGFVKGCRWFIGLDGCHLKGPYGGVLLSAVALDANNGIFPLAVCVCESENADSWKWFLEILYQWLEVENTCAMTFMTDRQKGVLQALDTCWPGATVRHCARHIFANLRKKHPQVVYRTLFWAAARAYTQREWKDNMESIKTIINGSHGAFDYLVKVNPSEWARHTFEPHVKCDHVTNNMTESWNGWLGEFRGQPVLCLLEFIRKKIMKRLCKRLSQAKKWSGKLPPNVKRKLDDSRKYGRFMKVIEAGEYEFEVLDANYSTFVVNLQRKTCSCGAYQISGIPCKHVMPCIASKREDAADYRERIGRPKIRRIREQGEGQGNKATVRCGNCKEFGHNRRACKESKAQTAAPILRQHRSRNLGGQNQTSDLFMQPNMPRRYTQLLGIMQQHSSSSQHQSYSSQNQSPNWPFWSQNHPSSSQL